MIVTIVTDWHPSLRSYFNPSVQEVHLEEEYSVFFPFFLINYQVSLYLNENYKRYLFILQEGQAIIFDEQLYLQDLRRFRVSNRTNMGGCGNVDEQFTWFVGTVLKDISCLYT